MKQGAPKEKHEAKVEKHETPEDKIRIKIWDLIGAIENTKLTNAQAFIRYFAHLINSDFSKLPEREARLSILTREVEKTITIIVRELTKPNKKKPPGKLSVHCCKLLCCFARYGIQLPLIETIDQWLEMSNNKTGWRHPGTRRPSTVDVDTLLDSRLKAQARYRADLNPAEGSWRPLKEEIDRWFHDKEEKSTRKDAMEFLSYYVTQRIEEADKKLVAASPPTRTSSSLFDNHQLPEWTGDENPESKHLASPGQ